MIEELTLKQAADGLRTKKFSTKELLKSSLERIKRLEPKIDAFLLISEEIAQKQAEKADFLFSTNQNLSTLTGIPTALKDVIVTRGIRTTAASKILENFDPPYSATVYEKLEEKGAVLVGKTNLDEFAMGASTENSAYKVTKNPWDLTKVPGGSSGGSTAAISSGMVCYSLGSDTGGSIRQPAGFCGVVGFKPTYGRVSRYGLIAMASSLDQIGPITKTVEDAALVLNEITGHDQKDSTSVKKEPEDFTSYLNKDIKGMRIGVPKEFFGEGLESAVEDGVKKAIKRLETLGAKVEEISLPHTREAISVYYLIMPSEVSSNMARYDGNRFGKDRHFFGSEVKRRIMLGTYALSSGYYDAYYLKAAKVRNLLSQELSQAFKKVDVIVGPTSPTLAFNIGEKADDPLAMYLADLFTVTANLAGIPAASMPCGLAKGLPIGLQVMADHWQEGKILSLAHTYETNFPFTEKPPLD